jgi:hypothetical protein
MKGYSVNAVAAGDSNEDRLIPVNQAVEDLAPNRNRKRINPSTIFRWITKGLEGLDGNRIRLQVWYVGRQPHTTHAAIQTFVDAVTVAKRERSARTQQGAAEVTAAELNAAGLLSKRRKPGV